MNSKKKINVYFDGKCHLCSSEISAYKRLINATKIDFVDITDPKFQPEKFGLDRVEVNKVLHVSGENGKLYTGVDAFIKLWQVLEIFPILIFLGRTQPSRAFFKIGYYIFSRFIRPILPKKQCMIDG